MDIVLGLELPGGLDALPGGAQLDEHTFLGNALLSIELDQPLGLGDLEKAKFKAEAIANRSYLLGYLALLVEAEPGVDLGGDSAGDDLEDLATEEDEELVDGGLDLCLEAAALAASEGNGGVDETLVLLHPGRGEDEAGVGGGVLRLELLHGLEVAGVGDDGGQGLELLEGGHLGGECVVVVVVG